jgi:hypothetical protein
MNDTKNIRLWDTKLKYIGNNEVMKAYSKPYIVTEFARNTNNDFIFVVQLLQKVSGQEGVTGLHCYIFNEQEFKENFEEIVTEIIV